MATSPPTRQHPAPALFRLLSDSALSRAALNACGAPLALLDAASPKHPVCYVNAAFAAYFGFGESEAIGKSLATLLLRGDEALLQRVLAESASAWPLSAWRKDGAALQVQLALGAIRDVEGRLTHWVLTFSDRSELARLRAEVESLVVLRLEIGGQPARGAQQPRVEIAPADELHAERQPIRSLHQR